MPSTTSALTFAPVDCSDKVDSNSNHIFLDIENLLKDWPTYTITFTPTLPGPVTLILRLKDASRFKYIEDTESDTETKDDPDATFVSKETTSKAKDDPNIFTATPVGSPELEKTLHQKKHKLGHGHFFGDGDSTVWPPRWPRGYRDISSLLISAFESLKITMAEIEAIDETT